MTQQGGASGGDLTGARLLLKRIRTTMARNLPAQRRLDEVVRTIAGAMVAEVCSVYVLRAGEVLELFATEGLKAEAVHLTRLRVGEGLVGDIASHARPLALADAQHHPQFAYRPETGEELYQSFMGVPVLRSGRVLGVLVVQNKTRRHYTEEEVETMETVAMVVAELVAGGELIGREELTPVTGIGVLPERLDAQVLAPGLALGTAVLHQPDIQLTQLVAEEPLKEIERLDDAFTSMKLALDELLTEEDGAGGGEHREVLETYRMLAEDRGWANRIIEAIETGLTAEAAVQKVQNDMRARMRDIQDPYLRERLSDLDDLNNRLLRHLLGIQELPAARDLPDNAILVARNMGPAELLDYDRRRLKGVVLEEGTASSHVAIVARALDIPLLGHCANLMSKVQAGDSLVLDGENEQVFLRPSEDILQSFALSMNALRARQVAYAADRDLPTITKDGVAIQLMINAGLLIDVPQMNVTGAAGIGLYRTEVTFMVAHSFPDVARQRDVYARVLDVAEGRPVIFRTLDIGSDKVLPYWHRDAEENPAMGWRALRISLDRPAMLRQQLRAMILAAGGRALNVMFPMVSLVEEFDDAKEILVLELQRAEEKGNALPESVKVGAMFEVPALFWQLEEMLERVDFLSIGSNDLAQFVFAADRGNAQLQGRYDNLSPAFQRLIGGVIDAGTRYKKPISVCGEMAGDPIDAMALLALGLRTLSVAPPAIGPLRAMIRSLDLVKLQAYVAALGIQKGPDMRSSLRAFARDHGVAL
ncbi:phosphoenolpyruvate--protein phosphotransferase [Dongia sp.]|uniref:phosphoenolpyruvate--protein phosphotransferase n=1 Tax=Dongia sp. TaxID=1977262 RepID=UPI0035AEAA6F